MGRWGTIGGSDGPGADERRKRSVVDVARLEESDRPEATVIRPRTAPWLLVQGLLNLGGRGEAIGPRAEDIPVR